MVIGIISCVMIILNVIAKRSKKAFLAMFIWMWIIMAFTYGIADESVYISRYNNFNTWMSNSELLYSTIILICNKLGMNFQAFKIFITGIQLLLIYSTVWKMAKYPNLVIALYFVFPFPLNVAQMRNALATAIFIFGCRYLLTDDEKIQFKVKSIYLNENDIKYIFCVLLATYVHTASLLWLLLLIAKKLTIKNNVIVVGVVNFLIYFVFSPQNLQKLVSKFGAGDRIGAYFSQAYQDTAWRHFGAALIQILFTAGMMIIMSIIIANKENIDDIYILLKINIIMLCLVALVLRYTGEVYRLQEGIAVINFILLSNGFSKGKFELRKISWNNLITSSVLFVYIIIIFGIAILLYLTPTILTPILNNNYLVDIMFK